MSGWGHLAASIAGLVAILSLVIGSGGITRLLDTPVFRLLGDASYGIYIYQVGFFVLASSLFHTRQLSLPQFLMMLTALVAFAIASVKLYEVPARHLLLKFANYQRRPLSTQRLPESGEDSRVFALRTRP